MITLGQAQLDFIRKLIFLRQVREDISVPSPNALGLQCP